MLMIVEDSKHGGLFCVVKVKVVAVKVVESLDQKNLTDSNAFQNFRMTKHTKNFSLRKSILCMTSVIRHTQLQRILQEHRRVLLTLMILCPNCIQERLHMIIQHTVLYAPKSWTQIDIHIFQTLRLFQEMKGKVLYRRLF